MARTGKRSRPIIVTATIMSVVVLLAAPRTYAFMGIGDTSDVLLADLVASAAKQLVTLSETLSTAKKTFDETKRLAGYAEDAYALAASFRHFDAERFGQRFLSDMDDAYPDAAFYRDQDQYGRWVQGGRLLPLVRFCLDRTISKDADGHIVFNTKKLCTQLRQELSTSQVLTMLGDAFGAVPAESKNTPEGLRAQVIDVEVAAQIAAQTSQWNRTQRIKQRVEQWMADCVATSDGNGASAACDAAAQQAQMEMLAEQSETNRLLAEQARLLALQLSQSNAELKHKLTRESARRTALTEDKGAGTINIKAADGVF